MAALSRACSTGTLANKHSYIDILKAAYSARAILSPVLFVFSFQYETGKNRKNAI